MTWVNRMSEIGIREAKSADDINAICRFRYDVYISEQGRSIEGADHERREVREPLDHCSRILIAEDADGLVGCIRTTVMTYDSAAAFPEYAFHAFHRFREFFERKRVAMTTRLLLRAKYQRSKLALVLPMRMYRYCLDANLAFNLIDIRPKYHQFFRRLGFRRSGDDITRAHVGMLTPMVLVVRDRSHLESVDSPLLQEWREHTQDDDAIELFNSDISKEHVYATRT